MNDRLAAGVLAFLGVLGTADAQVSVEMPGPWPGSTSRPGGIGRLVSISQVGLPAPAAVWLGYLIPELVVAFVIAIAQLSFNRDASRTHVPA